MWDPSLWSKHFLGLEDGMRMDLRDLGSDVGGVDFEMIIF